MRRFLCSLVVLAGLLQSGQAQAGPIIWGINASFGPNMTIEAFDTATGLLVPGQQFLAPNPTAVNENGRGIAVLGTTIYYSALDSGRIYMTDTVTHADLGVLVDTGLNGVYSIASDGVSLYVVRNTVANNEIRKYDPTTGAFQGSVFLGPPNGTVAGRDGFEITPTGMLANRGQTLSPYDLYDLAGNLVTASFIDPAANLSTGTTGIAFDGTFYYTSDVLQNRLGKYDSAGNFLGNIDLSANPNPSFGQRFLEDLSFDNAIQNGGVVPEPATLALAGFGFFGGLVGYRLRRRKVAS